MSKEKWEIACARLIEPYRNKGYKNPMCPECGRTALKIRNCDWDGKMAWEFQCGSEHEWKVRK